MIKAFIKDWKEMYHQAPVPTIVTTYFFTLMGILLTFLVFVLVPMTIFSEDTDINCPTQGELR
jgi:hypothetical protein